MYKLAGNLLSCSADKTVKLQQIETGLEQKSFEFEEAVNCVKYLNGEFIAVALENGEIQIKSHKKIQILKTISAHQGQVRVRLKFVINHSY